MTLASNAAPDAEDRNAADGDAAGKPFDTYPGGKDAAGSAERLIRLFPPHSLYVELFLGNGACLRRKRPALRTIGIDADPDVIAAWRRANWPGVELVNGDGIAWIEQAGAWLPADALVYADPPYRMSTRSGKRLYRCELSDDDHARLLRALLGLPCSVVVSSYDDPLYRSSLAGWGVDSWDAMTRGGPRTEYAWFRASLPSFGLDARHVGRDFRDRWRITKKVRRWRAKIRELPPGEREAVLQAILTEYAGLAATPPPASAAAPALLQER